MVFKGILFKYVLFISKNYVGSNFVSPMQKICAEWVKEKFLEKYKTPRSPCNIGRIFLLFTYCNIKVRI